MAIELASRGARAVLSGDICHTPPQCREPGWSANCDTATLVMTAHFPSLSVGFVRPRGEAFDWVYDG